MKRTGVDQRNARLLVYSQAPPCDIAKDNHVHRSCNAKCFAGFGAREPHGTPRLFASRSWTRQCLKVKMVGRVSDLNKSPRKETGVLTSIIYADVASFDSIRFLRGSLALPILR